MTDDMAAESLTPNHDIHQVRSHLALALVVFVHMTKAIEASLTRPRDGHPSRPVCHSTAQLTLQHKRHATSTPRQGMLLYMSPNELDEPITMTAESVVVVVDGLVAASESAGTRREE